MEVYSLSQRSQIPKYQENGFIQAVFERFVSCWFIQACCNNALALAIPRAHLEQIKKTVIVKNNNKNT
jgi:hypothetical protein